jgi:phosphoserine phosphatase
MAVAADLEGTLTTGAQLIGLGRYLLKQGRVLAALRFYVPRVPGLLLVKFGLIDKQAHGDRLVRDQAKLLKGYSEQQLIDAATWIVEHELWPKRREQLIAELGSQQAQVILCTGAFQPIVDVFARRINVTGIGTPLEMRDGRSTGQLGGPVVDGPEKVEKLRPVVDGMLDQAYGDAIGDVPMLEWSRAPTAVHPDDKLKKVAQSKGWRIVAA